MSLQDEMLTFRAKNNVSQRKAAELAGITLQTWYSVEKGHQNPSSITERKIRLVMGGVNESINQPDKAV